MSAHAANLRLAGSYSLQTHTSVRSPALETGDVGDNSGSYNSGKRDVNIGGGARDPLAPPTTATTVCNGGRSSGPPCATTSTFSAKATVTSSSNSGVSASDYTVNKSNHASGSYSYNHNNNNNPVNNGSCGDYNASAISSSPSNILKSTKDAMGASEGGGSSVFHGVRSHNLNHLGERSSPASVRRSGSSGEHSSRESRMDTSNTNFRLRLRKGAGEGVTKKGPLVAKHPSSMSSSSSVSQPTSASQAKEVRSPVGSGPPSLGSHRRRGGSPDPRASLTSRTRNHQPRDSPRSSPKTSPRSSPKSSPVRQLHRERSMSPGSRRYVPRSGGGMSSRGHPSRVTTTPPSPPVKRSTPPTSPRVRRQRSPGGGTAARRNPSPKVGGDTVAPKGRQKRNTSPVAAARAPSRPPSPTTTVTTTTTSGAGLGGHIGSTPRPPSPNTTGGGLGGSSIGSVPRLPSPNTPGASGGGTLSNSSNARRPPSPTATSNSSSTRPPSPGGSKRPPSPRGTSPRGRGASPGSRGPPISEESLAARVKRALKARLYLLHQPGPNSFTVGGDSPTHKYKVIIGPQTCSCGHGPYCVHVLFVMVRVLQVAEADPVLMTGCLKDFEIEQLMTAYEERLKKAVRARERRQSGSNGVGSQSSRAKGGRSSPSTPAGPASSSTDTANGDEDALCPICLMCMVEGESLVMCEAGCHNFLHEHCMAVWADDRKAQGQPVLCPLCRAPWPLKHHTRLTPTLGSMPLTRTHVTTSTTAARSPPLAPDYAFPVMSASFSGVCNSGRQSPTTGLMTRSLTAAYPHSHSPYADSAYSSPGGGSSFGILGSAYPPTVKGEVSAAIVASASEEAVPLPRSEPIPAEHESTAASWVNVFGKELVACLFSRDWAVRETGLRRLAHEVVKVLHWDRLVTGDEKRHQVIHCCANILAQVANDPVYKVYLACLRCVRVLLSHLNPSAGSEVTALQELFRPLVHTLLLKCADGNRRTSQISIDSIMELCRGQEGELALATQVIVSSTPGLGAISYVLSCILDDTPPSEAPWQWLLGRLCVLDRLVDEFPSEFQMQYVPLQPSESGYKLQNYDRLMTVVEFAFKALGSSHATVSKLARRVYICGARFAAAEPAVFHQVCDMLAKLDVSLQMRLKRRLRSMQGQHSDRKTSLARMEGKWGFGTWDLGDTAGPRLVRSVSHSPSRMLSALRSSSQSPARQPLPNSPTKKDIERTTTKGPPGHTSSPPRPTHLPLDSFESKFKEKQAKLRLYHKTRPKQDIPFVVQNVLVSPVHQQHRHWSPLKMGGALHRGGLSQSHGDALDVSPQTPLKSVAPPQFSFKDVVSSPATPTAPHCTPVRETAPLLGQNECESKQGEYQPWTPQETPLPVIPGLDLLPAHLGEALHPYEQNVEGGQYEEGRDWVRGPLLGTGAFSSCYQARDVRTGTLMAVKQVSFCRNNEEDQERLEASVEEEILIMSRLRNTNIVRLLGASRHATSFSVFTEWMAGGSVATMLDKYGTFSEHVILKYTKQILAGLSYLHDNKILHRDLKGANLLVDSTGQWLRIGDFGTAARMASKSTVTDEFKGQLLGTIAFMAPEVVRGEDYGRSCDVWSVGCCVIEMATTKPPWGTEYLSNQLKLIYKIATSNGPPAIPDTLSAAARDLALRCLEIKSERRPPVKELLQHPCFDTKPP